MTTPVQITERHSAIDFWKLYAKWCSAKCLILQTPVAECVKFWYSLDFYDRELPVEIGIGSVPTEKYLDIRRSRVCEHTTTMIHWLLRRKMDKENSTLLTFRGTQFF